ncbi:MAG: hypothetical protein ACRC8A_13235 [Microcoleaceae cyanobacterium]
MTITIHNDLMPMSQGEVSLYVLINHLDNLSLTDAVNLVAKLGYQPEVVLCQGYNHSLKKHINGLLLFLYRREWDGMEAQEYSDWEELNHYFTTAHGSSCLLKSYEMPLAIVA